MFWLWARHNEGNLNLSTAKSVTCVRAIHGAEITVAVLAQNAAAVAAQTAQLTGVTRVVAVENPANEPVADVRWHEALSALPVWGQTLRQTQELMSLQVPPLLSLRDAQN